MCHLSLWLFFCIHSNAVFPGWNWSLLLLQPDILKHIGTVRTALIPATSRPALASPQSLEDMPGLGSQGRGWAWGAELQRLKMFPLLQETCLISRLTHTRKQPSLLSPPGRAEPGIGWLALFETLCAVAETSHTSALMENMNAKTTTQLQKQRQQNHNGSEWQWMMTMKRVELLTAVKWDVIF